MVQQLKQKQAVTCARCQARFKTNDPEGNTLCKKCRQPKKPGTSNSNGAPPNKKADKPAAPPLDVQAVVNEMMWQHGTNLAQRGDYPDLLAAAGLAASQVTRKVLAQASKAFNQRVKEEADKPKPPSERKLNWQVAPIEETLETAKVHSWETSCGRYQVRHIDSMGRGGIEFGAYHKVQDRWDACELDAKQNGNYPKYVKNLEAALLVVEKFHAAKHKLESVVSNRQEVLAQAKELGLLKRLPAAPAAPNGTPGEGKAPKAGAPRSKHTILGHSLGRVIMWMGGNGFTMDKVKEVLAHYGIEGVNPATVRTYWTDGKNPKYARWADLSTEQQAELKGI